MWCVSPAMPTLSSSSVSLGIPHRGRSGTRSEGICGAQTGLLLQTTWALMVMSHRPTHSTAWAQPRSQSSVLVSEEPTTIPQLQPAGGFFTCLASHGWNPHWRAVPGTCGQAGTQWSHSWWTGCLGKGGISPVASWKEPTEFRCCNDGSAGDSQLKIH